MKTLWLILLLVSTSAWAQTSLRFFDNEKYQEIKIAEYQKIHLNADCLKSGSPHCQAWTVVTGQPVTLHKVKGPWAGDPAAQYCWDVGAKNRILKAADNKQFDYCVFADKSMVDAWDLYSKHFPKK